MADHGAEGREGGADEGEEELGLGPEGCWDEAVCIQERDIGQRLKGVGETRDDTYKKDLRDSDDWIR